VNIDLYRFAYTPDETQGRLVIDGQTFWTIERSWIKGERKGGMPFKSCIPDGEYQLVPFERSNGDVVPALVNHDLGVHLHSGPRTACLIHSGNVVDDVVGCIAPGLARVVTEFRGKTQVMVTNSRAAMAEIGRLMPFDETHTLTIHNAGGTT